jgi:hypothetical protein
LYAAEKGRSFGKNHLYLSSVSSIPGGMAMNIYL